MEAASVWSAAIGAVFGALVSILVQAGARWLRIQRARRALQVDLGLLLRHIDASLKSLELAANSPGYILAARLRYARIEELLLTTDRLEMIEALKEHERARLLIVAVRNSDILLDEIAGRIADLPEAERARALEDGRLNLRILRETIAHLALDGVAVVPQTSVGLAGKVRKRLEERTLHAEAERSD